MSATTETASAPITPPSKASRIGRIVQWSARITSLPILALVLMSLLPTLAHFSVAAKDDRIQALCLAATCSGLLVGWRWAGIGGGLVVVSVGGMMAQNDSGAFADPFSIAFGLQGLLFLLSWGLNAGPAKASPGPVTWTRKVVVGSLAVLILAGAAMVLRGPGPVPLPKDKQVFAGTWEDGTGLRLEITPEGRALISRAPGAKVENFNLPVAPGESGVFNVYFHGDSHLEFAAGFLKSSKTYQVDRPPHPAGKQVKMVLNGSDPYNPRGGMALSKAAP